MRSIKLCGLNIFPLICFVLVQNVHEISSVSIPDMFLHEVYYYLETGPDVTEPGSMKGNGPTTDMKSPCPKGSAFYNETSSCEMLLQQGPCGDLQVFYLLSKDSHYGDCACISNSDGCSRNVKTNRMVLPSPDRKQCFWAFSKGPCKKEEWYILNLKTLKPECEKNPCSETSKDKSNDSVPLKKPISENDLFSFTLNGTCYQTFSKGFCTENQYVQFLGTNDPYPKCYNIKSGPPKCELGIFGAGPVVGMPCEPGYKLVGEDCVLANVEFE